MRSRPCSATESMPAHRALADKSPTTSSARWSGATSTTGHGAAARSGDKALLECSGLSRRPHFRRSTCTVREGEIVGLFGLIGSGAPKWSRPSSGSIAPTRDAMRGGWRASCRMPRPTPSAPASRWSRRSSAPGAAVSTCRLATTCVAGRRPCKAWVASCARERNDGEACVTSLGDQKARRSTARPTCLSGGNQQKVVLASGSPPIRKFCCSTSRRRASTSAPSSRSKTSIRAARGRGMACLVVSSDLPEILALADRIVVIEKARVQRRARRATAPPRRP